jgi:hypothetical protein
MICEAKEKAEKEQLSMHNKLHECYAFNNTLEDGSIDLAWPLIKNGTHMAHQACHECSIGQSTFVDLIFYSAQNTKTLEKRKLYMEYLDIVLSNAKKNLSETAFFEFTRCFDGWCPFFILHICNNRNRDPLDHHVFSAIFRCLITHNVRPGAGKTLHGNKGYGVDDIEKYKKNLKKTLNFLPMRQLLHKNI